MDFNLKIYAHLIKVIAAQEYEFLTFKKFIKSKCKVSKIIILRHDVDRLPINSLRMAEVEHDLGIEGTYYFRVVPESYNLEIIDQIAKLGHEIGYHYEDIDLVTQRQMIKVNSKKDREELIDKAYESFCKNLEKMREVAEIKTICMHGSPLSKYDNKIIWEKYNYKNLGLVAEPYYDVDYNEFAYLTDTGRRWNGNSVSVRDKVNSKCNFNFKSTQDIIDNMDKLPNKIMFTIHPERWDNDLIPWIKQLVVQNLKNVIKYWMVKKQTA